ncbi:13450_t:CDS:2 [Entrophospora sp. SA101]|nr:13450_t:CDS:2 [Entrophospora sp. SA101]
MLCDNNEAVQQDVLVISNCLIDYLFSSLYLLKHIQKTAYLTVTSKVHEYFKSASEEWNIQDFLEQCDVEPFDQKIDCYIKSLEAIVNHGGYKNNCQIARSWNNERSHNKELNDKTNNFFQNSSGQMSINIIENLGNLEIESNEKDNSNKIFNEEDKAGDNIDLDYVSKLNYSQVNQLCNKSFEETEEPDISEYQDEPTAKKK